MQKQLTRLESLTEKTNKALSYIVKVEKQVVGIVIIFFVALFLYDIFKYSKNFMDIYDTYSDIVVGGIIVWFGIRLVYYVQIINKRCGELFLNSFILFGMIFFLFGSILSWMNYFFLIDDEYLASMFITPITFLSVMRIQALRIRIENRKGMSKNSSKFLQKQQVSAITKKTEYILSYLSNAALTITITVTSYLTILILYDITVFSRDLRDMAITYTVIIISGIFIWFSFKFIFTRQYKKIGYSKLFYNALALTTLIIFAASSVVLGIYFFTEGFFVATFIAPLAFIATLRSNPHFRKGLIN